MKRIALIIVLAFPFAVFAQNPYKPVIHNYTEVVTVDTAFLKVQYTMSFRGLNEKDSQLLTDTRIVLVGKTARKDYSYWIDKREEENHTRIASGKNPYLDRRGDFQRSLAHNDGGQVLLRPFCRRKQLLGRRRSD